MAPRCLRGRSYMLPWYKQHLRRTLQRNEENVVYNKMCPICCNVISGKGNVTKDCGCDRTGEQEAWLIDIDIKARIKELLAKPGMIRSLQNRLQREENADPNVITDIYDDEMYRRFRQPRQILNSNDDFSMTIFSDGVKVSTSSGGFLTIFLIINELSPRARWRHIMLAGIWISNRHPTVLNFILRPFVVNLRHLSQRGIDWEPDGGAAPRNSKFHTLLMTTDSCARQDLLNMTRFNEQHGCTFCLHPGHQLLDPSVSVYPDVAHP